MKHFILISLLFIAPHVYADNCDTHSKRDDICTIQILDLRPTQLSVGMREVQARTDDIKKMSDHDLKKYIEDHTIPAVLGPHHEFYMTDHHHFALALLDAGVDSADLKVQYDWSDLSENQFWDKMKSAQLVYLYDENGLGPVAVSKLPSDVRGLKDDIFRSLAWSAKKGGAYKDSAEPFADFMWANFFRERIAKELVESDFNQATREAQEFAKSPEANGLPGYIGRSQ
jgi:hypothetical protein